MHEALVLPPINWWTLYGHAPPMGWFLLDFLLFVGLFSWASRGPLAGAFRDRHAAIRRAVSDAAAAHARARQEQQEARAKLLALETEIAQLTEMNARDGELERDRAVADAIAYGTTLRADSETVAVQELKRARLRLKQQLIGGVIGRAEALIVVELARGDAQARLIDDAIDSVASTRPFAGALSREAQQVISG